MPIEFIETNNTGPPPTGAGSVIIPDWGSKIDENDGSTNSQPSEVKAQAEGIYQIALPIIFGLIIAIGIIGNVMVIVVITTRRKLRTVTNFLLLNLAVADVAFLVICGPVTLVHYAVSSWPLGSHMCQVIQYFLYVTCYVTVYTLVAVAVVRYILMVRMSTHPCVKNPRYILFIILGIWAVSLVVNVPVPLMHGESVNKYTNETECVISCPTNGKLFFSSFFIFAFALPLLIVALLYTLLVLHLKKNQRNSMVGKSKSGSGSKSSHVTRLLILVVVTFALCWLPLQVHLMWGTFGTLPGSMAYRMSLIVWHALVFLNSAMNPIIYHFFSSEFRENFKAICCCKPDDRTSSSSGSGSKGLLMKTTA